jgi:hypothetical protein
MAKRGRWQEDHAYPILYWPPGKSGKGENIYIPDEDGKIVPVHFSEIRLRALPGAAEAEKKQGGMIEVPGRRRH